MDEDVISAINELNTTCCIPATAMVQAVNNMISERTMQRLLARKIASPSALQTVVLRDILAGMRYGYANKKFPPKPASSFTGSRADKLRRQTDSTAGELRSCIHHAQRILSADR